MFLIADYYKKFAGSGELIKIKMPTVLLSGSLNLVNHVYTNAKVIKYSIIPDPNIKVFIT